MVKLTVGVKMVPSTVGVESKKFKSTVFEHRLSGCGKKKCGIWFRREKKMAKI